MINMGGFIVLIITWSVYTLAMLWKSSFTYLQGGYFSFRCQYGVLGWINPPSIKRKIGVGCHHFVKYTHRVDRVPISNKTLFLRPLIMNLLSATVPSFLQQVDWTFQERSTKILCGSKWSGFIYWRIGRNILLNQD